MPSVQIKDVPEHTHAVLRQRAAAAHQSLQEYLRARLIEEAVQPTMQEILDPAGGRSANTCSASVPANSECIPPTGSHTAMAPNVSPW